MKFLVFFCILSLLSAQYAHAKNPILPLKNETFFNQVNNKSTYAVVKATAEKLLIPGVVVVLRTPLGNFDVNYGTSQIDMDILPNKNTHFRIASNTKTMTAAVIIQMIEEGKIKFTDPVSRYIADVPNGNKITIEMLLKMRSGLYNYTNSPEFAEVLDKTPEKAWTPKEVLAIAFNKPPLFAPGEKYDYCNTNYVLLGLIAERIQKKPLRDIFQSRLFTPLGMQHTLLPEINSTELPLPFSHGYMYGASAYALVDKHYTKSMIHAVEVGSLQPIDYTWQNPSYASGAGGLISTAEDLSIWIKALVEGKIFSKTSYLKWQNSLELEDPENPDGPAYGYGIARQKVGDYTFYYHGGEMPGYNSYMGYDPLHKITLIIWTNMPVYFDGQHTANSVMIKLFELMGFLKINQKNT